MPSANLKYINIGLHPSQVKMLEQLETVTGRTKSQLIREAIGGYHADRVLNRPTCAAGMPCMAPHLRPPFPENPRQGLIGAAANDR